MAQNRIPWYSNGNCPLSRLIVIDRGYNATDGNWEHRLPRATLRRWRRLVNRAYARTGRTLGISDGWGTDRPYFAQVIAKNLYGNLAATPGTSSHGMTFNGYQTAAIDAYNWAWVYENHGGYDAWLSDLRAEGFDRLPDGYPLEGERHHIIDYNLWDDEPEFGGAPAGTDSEDFDMPLTNQDLVNILQASFATGRRKPDGSGEYVSIATALGAVYFYGDLMNKLVTALPDAVWSKQLKHALNEKMVPAGDLLRYEPAEHQGTRKAVAAAASPLTDEQLEHISAVLGADTARVVKEVLEAHTAPQPEPLVIDLDAIAKAVNDDAANRLAN